MKIEEQHNIKELIAELKKKETPKCSVKITPIKVRKAISNIPDWLNIVGNGPNRQKYIVEVRKITEHHYAEYLPINQDLYNLVIKQFEESKDLVSLKDVQKSNRLPNTVYKFVDQFKSNGIHDYLGSNIFLMNKHKTIGSRAHQTYYLPSRKIKGFVDDFFKWLLSNSAKTTARLINKETGELDDFYTLEEVQAGNSKKARILGFNKSISGKTEAICGFYNNHIEFLPELQRSTQGLTSPSFNKYDARKYRPVFFAFDLKDVMNRKMRNYFNLFVASLRQKHVSIFFSGEKYRVTVENYNIYMNELRPNSSQSKTMQGRTRRNYGNLSTEDVTAFLQDNVLEDELVNFLKENVVEDTSHITVSKRDKNKIIVGSNYYPVTWWVPRSTKNILKKIGTDSGLPPQFILDFEIESWLAMTDFDNEDELLEALNNMVGKWNRETSNYISNWQKKYHTKDVQETFEKIDDVLKGRLENKFNK